MHKIGIFIDYGNICTDYNTVYLDRDNNDRATVDCMSKVMRWLKPLLADFMDDFNYTIYRIDHEEQLKLDEIVKKRFLFYSLEKELTAQTFILQEQYMHYPSLTEWSNSDSESVVIQNDDEGEGISLYFNEHSKVHSWLKEKLGDNIDEIPFSD